MSMLRVGIGSGDRNGIGIRQSLQSLGRRCRYKPQESKEARWGLDGLNGLWMGSRWMRNDEASISARASRETSKCLRRANA